MLQGQLLQCAGIDKLTLEKQTCAQVWGCIHVDVLELRTVNLLHQAAIEMLLGNTGLKTSRPVRKGIQP